MALARDLGLVAAGGALAGYAALYHHARTGIPTMDRFQIRGYMVAAFLMRFGTSKYAADLPRLVRLAMATTANESRGIPKNFLGDTAYPAGPSIGPYQIYRATAKELGLYKPPAGLNEAQERADYITHKDSLFLMARWKAAVFASKLAIAEKKPDAGWDVLWTALRRYNGSGPMAEAYRRNAHDFYQRTFGAAAGAAAGAVVGNA